MNSIIRRKFIIAAALLGFTLSISGCQTTPEKYISAQQQFVDSFLDGFILPKHEQFVDANQQLLSRAETLCQPSTLSEVDEPLFTQTREAWKQSMLAWQAVQVVNFGPLVSKNMGWKIQFYFDRKNLVKQKINAIISSNEIISVDLIANHSVPAQGLPAIEYLLFDPDAGKLSSYTDNPKQCLLLMAISENLLNLSTELLNDWQGSYGRDYFSSEAAFNTSIAGITSKADELVNKKYLRPFGLNLKKPTAKPYSLESWRSQFSLDLIQAQIAAYKEIYIGTDTSTGLQALVLDQLISEPLILSIQDNLKPSALETNQVILNNFDAVESVLSSSPKPLFTEIKKTVHQEFFIKQQKIMMQFRKTMVHDLPDALGVKLGFNSNDGD